jgi:hypothetical protein
MRLHREAHKFIEKVSQLLCRRIPDSSREEEFLRPKSIEDDPFKLGHVWNSKIPVENKGLSSSEVH